MAADNFEACLAEVLRHEGGLSLDRADRGNWTSGKVGVGTLKGTNMGISAMSYPNEDIRGMTRARAGQIYRRDFWNAVRGDDLPAGLDLVAFDAAVNSGSGRGARWLQQALGVTVDGKIGPQTIEAAHAAHPVAVIDRACDARLAFLRQLSTWPRYGVGWARRVNSVRDVASGMVRSRPAYPTLPDTPQPSPAAEATGGLAWVLPGIIAAAAAAFFLLKG